MRLKYKILSSAILFIILLSVSDFLLGKTHFQGENKIFSTEDVNIFTESNCISFDDNTGYKPVWGNCGYPELSHYLPDRKEANILGLATNENIIILGDSNSDWSSYDRILEEKLNTNVISTGRSFKVINMGVAGFNTVQEVNLYLKDASGVPVKHIILQFSPNDFESPPVLLVNNNETRILSTDGTVVRPNQFLINHSTIYRMILSAKIGKQDKKISVPKKIGEVRKSLQKLKNFANEKNINLEVIVYPLFTKMNENESRQQILEILTDLKIGYIDLTEIPEFKDNPEQFALKTSNGLDITHSDRSFDALVAEEIYRLIKPKLN